MRAEWELRCLGQARHTVSRQQLPWWRCSSATGLSAVGPAGPRRSGEFSVAEGWATASRRRACPSSSLEGARNQRPALQRGFHWLAMWLWLDKSHDSFFPPLWENPPDPSEPQFLHWQSRGQPHPGLVLALLPGMPVLGATGPPCPVPEERRLYWSDVCRGGGGMDLTQQRPSRVRSDSPEWGSWRKAALARGERRGVWAPRMRRGRGASLLFCSCLLFTLH